VSPSTATDWEVGKCLGRRRSVGEGYSNDTWDFANYCVSFWLFVLLVLFLLCVFSVLMFRPVVGFVSWWLFLFPLMFLAMYVIFFPHANCKLQKNQTPV